MSRGTTLGKAIATRGILVDPLGGLGRATRGYVTKGSPASSITLDPAPLLSTSAVDANGIQRLLSDTVLEAHYVEVYRSVFWHPDREYTGFAADGYWYTNGVVNGSHNPPRATWSTEATTANIDCGTLDRFPRRILVVLTPIEVCIFDADDLTVWRRFRVARSSPPALGPVLGPPSSELRSVSFSNGFLVVATSSGIRIVDFRRDFAYTYQTSTSYRSKLTGLQNRNNPTYMDGLPVLPTLPTNNCTSVSVENISVPTGTDKRSFTLCGVGTSLGFCGMVLDRPGISAPQVKSESISRTFAIAWSVYDDGDGDSTSPYFIDLGSNWLGVEVSPGDTLITDALTTHTIVSVDQIVPGSRLTVSPELPLTASGAGYLIRRGCRLVRVQPDGTLYVSNGTNRITHVTNNSWYWGVTPVFLNLSTSQPTSELSAVVSSMNDLFITPGGDIYAATSLGVFKATEQILEDGALTPFLYSSTDVTEVAAKYKILVGSGRDCPAVAVDPETGNVLVSLNEPEGSWVKKSVVTEINTTIQQAFRHFDNVGIVRSIATYRNPFGPPDEVP